MLYEPIEEQKEDTKDNIIDELEKIIKKFKTKK
jgi:hypothetical protein